MSRIGRKPIDIPKGVTAELSEQTDGIMVMVKGPKGSLENKFSGEMIIIQEQGQLIIKRPSDSRKHRELHGLTRTLISNMVEGVSQGFEKSLEVFGVGYRAVKQGKKIVLSLGYSHPVEVYEPEGIIFEVPEPTKIIVKGIDKQKVGKSADDIMRKRQPDAYKGKGIRGGAKRIKLKAGKTGKK